MASARLTQAQLKTKLEALEVHVDSSSRIKAFAKDKTETDEDIGGFEASQGELITRYTTTLNSSPDTIDIFDLKEIVSWLRRTFIPNLTPFKARLAVLETHALSPDDNKKFLEKELERDAHIGHDEQEITDRYNTLLDSAPASIDPEKLARLTQRWKDSEP